MPTIKLNKERVLNLVGKKLSDDKLGENISFLGTDLEEINKKEIVVEIFPNRPDLLSEEGFARALSSFLGVKKGLKKYSAKKSNYVVNITREVGVVRPFTSCAVVKGLKLDDSMIKDIINIQEKLHVTYGRNRKRCAIGIYPMESIKWPITYTAMSPEKIKFIPLDEKKELDALQILKKHSAGREYGHLLSGFSEFPVFLDGKNQVLSVPPIINSEKTGRVSLKTKDVFIECSGFDYLVVNKAVNMICASLSDMGGELFEVKLNYAGPRKKYSPNTEPEKMILPTYYVEKYLGIKLDDKTIITCLEKMGYSAEKSGQNIKVFVPFYRTDVIHPIDLVEDVAIGLGYNNIEENGERVYTTGKENYSSVLKRKLREVVAGLGLVETSNFSLLNFELQTKIFGDVEDLIKINNSVSSEFDSLRKSLLPVLLNTLKNNRQHEYPQNIFEIGTVFEKDLNYNTGIGESDSLAVVLCSENADFTKAKQHLEAVMSALGVIVTIEKTDSPLFLKGRVGKIMLDKKEIGLVGEINPNILSMFELEMPVSGFEIDVNVLINN